MPRYHVKPEPSKEPPLPPLPLSSDTWASVVQALELSPQQARIVELLLCGMRDKQIALELGLRVPTIRTYFDRIFRRVGVQDRVELILRVFAVAHREGGSNCRR